MRPFNVKWEPEDDDDVSSLCLQRLEQMKQQYMAGVTDPNMLTESIRPPVSKVEPKHKEKQEWWSEWLDLQSAQESPQELREAAEAMYWLHQNMQTQTQIPQAMNQGMVAAAGAAPAALGQAMLQGGQGGAQDQAAEQQQQQEQQQHEAEQQDADRQAEMMGQVEDQRHQLELQQAESQGQIDLAREQAAGQLAVAKEQGKNQLAVAKARPKPKAA